MQIYDITKNFFDTPVYPGDPGVSSQSWFSIASGDACNLHTLSFGTHTSTHIDAPCHFMAGGKGISEIPLEKVMGPCTLVTADQPLTEDTLQKLFPTQFPKRLLIRGKAILTPEGAGFLAKKDVFLYGTELNTVGTGDQISTVHKILLGKEIVILETLDLSEVPDGDYLLCAQPLKLDGMDGCPVRAVLIR